MAWQWKDASSHFHVSVYHTADFALLQDLILERREIMHGVMCEQRQHLLKWDLAAWGCEDGWAWENQGSKGSSCAGRTLAVWGGMVWGAAVWKRSLWQQDFSVLSCNLSKQYPDHFMGGMRRTLLKCHSNVNFPNIIFHNKIKVINSVHRWHLFLKQLWNNDCNLLKDLNEN